MSQTVITKAFVEWKAKQAIDNQPVVLDEFIFAYIPGLDVNKPIANTEGLPAADKIVHRQAVSKAGVVNLNVVVYSVTMGAEVGDFDFNWIGLVNKASGTLASIIHAPTQRKVKNANGQQGNVLTRSVLMEFNGAQTETHINVPAETWQIDFTARLAGMDEAARLANQDTYGVGAFFESGFLVAKTGNQYFVTQGLGYIGGLRAALANNQNITLSAKPTKVWADVCYHGTVTSTYRTEIKITVAGNLANYTENGITHYVFALASIDAAGVITDLRPKGSRGEQQANSDFLRKDDNLAALNDKAKSRDNLGLGALATRDSVTAAEVNAADMRNNFAARMGIDRVLSGGNPPSSPGVWSVENCSWTPEQWGTLLCTSNRADLNTDRGKGHFYHYFFLSHSSKLYVATNVNNSGAGWQQLIGPAGGRVEYLDINKGLFIGDGLKVSAGARVDKNISVGEDLWVDRDLYVTGQGFINKNSHYDYSSNGENHRQTNGLHLQGAGDLFADIYHHEHIGKYHELGIHVANGGGDGWFGFRPDGALYLNGPGSALGVGAAKMSSDGNIFGSRWGNKWLWDAITDLLVARDNNINTRATWDYVNQNFVRDIRLASRGEIVTDGAMTEAPWGAVITGGNGNEGNQIGYMYFRYLQKNVNGNWYTVAYA